MNKKGQELTISSIIGGIFLTIFICGVLIYATQGATDSTNSALRSGALIIIGWGVLFLLFILVLFALFWLIKNTPQN